MRKLYFLSFLFFASCFSESNVEIGSGKTFIRYFNGGGRDEAIAFAETEDKGLIILANTSHIIDGLTSTSIKLIKTDEQGNKEWSKLYSPATGSYEGSGLLVLPGNDGYVVVGEYLNSNLSQLLTIAIGTDGEKIPAKEKFYPATNQLRGRAIEAIKDDAGKVLSYFVLAEIINPTGPENMMLAEITHADLSISWTRKYGAGQTGELSVLNKLFTVASGKDAANKPIYKAVWAGNITRQGESDMRIIKTTQDRQNVDFDLQIGNPGFNENANDICRFGFGYALTGSTNESTTGTQDILFQRLGEDGSVLSKQSFIIRSNVKNGELEVQGNKTGNGLAVTQDGGLLLIGTVPSNEGLEFGRGKNDLYLIKMNAFGEVAWQKSIGSRDEDVGVAALQASDGGYLLLGTSLFAGLETVLLIKTDNNGNIN